MKIHKIVPFFAFTFLTLTCAAQKKNIFKMHLSPEMKYEQKVSTTFENTISYEGDDAFLAKLKARGNENPEITKRSSISESVITTGTESSDGWFPITIEYTNSDTGDSKTGMPDGTKIFGRDSIGQKPVLDSIVSTEIPEASKKILLKSIQNSFVKIDFPEKKLKPGDTFVKEDTLSVPVVGAKVEILISTTYTLISVKKNIAVFDLSEVHTMVSQHTKFKLDASGSGSGKIKFDNKNHYFLEYDTNVEMAMNIDFNEYIMHLNQKNKIERRCVISKK